MLTRFTICLQQAEETKRTELSIEGDRKHYLDAAIVRIMKAKKTVAHQKLITETIDSVKSHFAPEVRTIKERIEQLIEQEYMRRDDEQDNVYVYVAWIKAKQRKHNKIIIYKIYVKMLNNFWESIQFRRARTYQVPRRTILICFEDEALRHKTELNTTGNG